MVFFGVLCGGLIYAQESNDLVASEATAAILSLSSPLDFQVFQRSSKAEGVLHIRGALTEVDLSDVRLLARVSQDDQPVSGRSCRRSSMPSSSPQN